MIFTLYKAWGWSVGKSMIEDAQVHLARAFANDDTEMHAFRAEVP